MDLKKEALKVLKKALPKVKDYRIELPKDSKLGDVSSTVSYSLVKKDKNPEDTAKEIVSKLKLTDSPFTEVKSQGPYINFFFDKDKISEKIIRELSNEDFMKATPKKDKVVVEFFQANTHKGVHIGHARNMIIGDSIARILEAGGQPVVRVSYGGDIGPHVAKCIWGYMNLGLKPEGDKGEWLGNIYAYAQEKLTNESVKKQVDELNKKLYEGDEHLTATWARTKEWSIEHMKRVLNTAGINIEHFIWESMVEKKGVEAVKKLLSNGVLKESEGAVIADLTEHGLGVIVVITKDGTPLYPAKDLGLVQHEFTNYKASKVIHVVGSEQGMYFKQLFKLFELAGFKDWAKNSVHRSYELVDLKDGKMSSRAGNVVLFTELYSKMREEAFEEFKKRNTGLAESKRDEVTHNLTISAIKYGMLSQDLNKKILFDYTDWVKFEGDTGPYIQYSFVRALKILNKITKVKPQKITIESPIEFELVKKLNLFTEVFNDAYQKLDPSIIAHYSYDLANSFSKFYEHCPVIDSALQGSRAKIVRAYVNVMRKVMDLMGLKPMEFM